MTLFATALRRPVCRRFVLSVVAGALVAAAAAGCSGSPSDHADPATSPSHVTPHASATTTPCLPRVGEAGYSHDETGTLWYGLIVVNSCATAEVNLNFRVNAVDSKGHVIGTSTSPPVLTVILPGQRLGVGSYITLSAHARPVARLEASVLDAQPVPVADFSSLPTPTVTGLSTGARDSDGLRQLSFDVTTTPVGTMLCAPHYTIIGRDTHGHIVYGITQAMDGPSVRTPVALPPTADPARTNVYVLQGAANLLNSSHVGC
jgi:hypothetical protein